MRLILALIVLFVLHHHLVVSRPYMGPNGIWSNIRQRSTVPTIFKSIQGSRFGIAPRHRFNFNTRFYPLEDQQVSDSDDLVNETEAFLNTPLIYDFPPKTYHQVPRQKSKIKSHSYYDSIPSRNIFTTTTTTPPPPIFDMDDEEFLLKQLEHGFNLHNDFKKLLYPRGDDGFRKKRNIMKWSTKSQHRLLIW